VVRRDLAFIIDDSLPFSSLSHALLKEGIDWLIDITLFDVYSGSSLPEGKKSLALRFTLRHPDRTLTDEDIQGIMQKIIVCSERHCGAYIRESI
jgi:phenylalanyl-tRNA synthetase beta chain